MGPGIAANQFQHRRRYRLQQSGRDSGRKGNSQRVAIASRILNGNQPLFSGYLDLEQSPGAKQPLQLAGKLGVGETAQQFLARKITDAQQQVVDAVRGANALGFEQALQLLFHFADGIGVQQLAQVGIAQQVTQLLLIDGEGLRAALGQRRIAVVDVIGHVAEQQRRSKGRGSAGVGNMHAHIALADGAQRLQQRRHIENVAHTLAVRFQQNGKRGIARGDGEQIIGALALLPQGRAALGPAARQEQRPRGTLAEFRRKQRGAAELPQHQVGSLFRHR